MRGPFATSKSSRDEKQAVIDQKWLDAHLATCPRCQAEMGFQKSLRRALVHHNLPQLRESFTSEVIGFIRASKMFRRSRALASFFKIGSLVGACLGIVWLAAVSGFARALATAMGCLSEGLIRSSIGLGEITSTLRGFTHPLGISYVLTMNCLAIALVVWAFSRISPILRRH